MTGVTFEDFNAAIFSWYINVIDLKRCKLLDHYSTIIVWNFWAIKLAAWIVLFLLMLVFGWLTFWQILAFLTFSGFFSCSVESLLIERCYAAENWPENISNNKNKCQKKSRFSCYRKKVRTKNWRGCLFWSPPYQIGLNK